MRLFGAPFAVATWLLLAGSAATADDTAPVIKPTITGELGRAGWYIGDVEIAWTVTDTDSAIDSSVGCHRERVSDDTAGRVFTCRASSLGRTASQSMTIKRDTSPPSIRLRQPMPRAAFYTGQVSRSAYQCSDGGSRIRSCTGTVADGRAIDTSWIGENAFRVTATDQAGNSQSLSQAYVVIQGRRTCRPPVRPFHTAQIPVRLVEQQATP